MSAEGNNHKGHRQRLLGRYLEHGIDSLTEQEILEIFLFSAYSRRNTSDISGALIEKFGSLEGVLNAGYDELREVDDVGATSAALITFMKDLVRRYGSDDFAGIKLDTSDRMREFCYNLFRGEKKEVCRVLFLDATMNMVSESVITRSEDNRGDYDMRLIVTKAVHTQGCNIVLAHCHPGGLLLPSSRDVAATRRAATILESLGLSLVDHLIVSEEGTYSMRAAGMLPDIWN